MRICSACGHALTPDGPCGFASVTVGEKTTYLCHADDHSCYMKWPKATTSLASGYLALPDAAEGTGETDSRDELGEASPVGDDQRCCHLHGRNCEPPSELCCERCTEADHPQHLRLAPCSNPDLNPNSDAVRDLAAPSNGSISSRPSPGADPRDESVAKRIWESPGGVYGGAPYWETLPVVAQRTYRELARHVLAAADAADRAADPPWIRVRCDKDTVGLIAKALGRVSDPVTRYLLARAVLAALAGEQ